MGRSGQPRALAGPEPAPRSVTRPSQPTQPNQSSRPSAGAGRLPKQVEHSRAWGRPGCGPASAWIGLTVALTLMAAAVVVPALTGWNVHDGLARFPWTWRPPLHAHWEPRVGPGSAAALAIAMLGTATGSRLAARLSWRRLLLAAWAVGLAWIVALALVDGPQGLGGVLGTHNSYLPTARTVGDPAVLLRQYVDGISLQSPQHWPIQVAGHPPGALLFFVLLVRLGLGSATAAGSSVAAVAATTPVAVLVTLRLLGAEALGRRVAPILVLAPAAIWAGVTADGMFGAVAAWGLAALAASAVRRSVGWAVVAGLLLGCCLFLSYGLVLLAVLAVAVLVAARSAYPLLAAGLSALAVVGGFAVAGFAWWDAYPVLVDRYWAGLANRRPAGYWWWGDLAAFCFSAGPLVGAGVAAAMVCVRDAGSAVSAASRRSERRVAVLLAGAGLLVIAVADASSMSKAEVERIWLPFVPWVLVGCALLPGRWRRWGLALQVVTALAVQHLLRTR